MPRAIEYLSVDQVIALHRRAIELYGGREGIRSEHQLASAVFQPQASAFGEDAYPGIAEKAAASSSRKARPSSTATKAPLPSP
jgi:death on curing protein